jgi:hypothetical protein
MTAPARARSESVHLGVQSLTIEHAIDHLVEAAQGVVENQLELAKLEVEVTIGRVLRGAASMAVGLFLLALATAVGSVAAYAALPAAWPAEQRLAIIATTCGVVGLALAWLGSRRMRTHGAD